MVARKLSYYNEAANFLNSFSKKAVTKFFHTPKKSTLDYFTFGMLLPNRHEDAGEYRYGFNGMEKDDEVSGEGNSYTTEFRQYDSRIGRWFSIDLLADSQPGWSPYKAFYNNPLRYNDISGTTEKERLAALAEARKYVTASTQTSSSYGFAGYHKGEPGQAIDCSGLVSQCAKASGFGYLNTAVKGDNHTYLKKGKPSSANGVANILNQPLTRKVNVNDIQPGNIVTMSGRVTMDGTPVGHVGFVDNIIRDDNGNVTGFTFIHSGLSTDPTETNIDLNNKSSYWVKNYGDGFNFWAWDTPDGTNPNSPPSNTEQSQSSTNVGNGLNQYYKDNIKFANDMISDMSDRNTNGIFNDKILKMKDYKKSQIEKLEANGGTYEKKYKEAGGPGNAYD
jgi:RHS repeat-associated protein